MIPYMHIRYFTGGILSYLNCAKATHRDCRGFLMIISVTCQDKEDDLKVGVKSTALRFGDSTKQWISAFGAASIGSLALSGYNAELGWC